MRLTAERIKTRMKEKEKGKKKKFFFNWGSGRKWERERAPARVGTSHVTWPKPVSGAALIEAGDDGPRHGYCLWRPSLSGADYSKPGIVGASRSG